jgi:hypothetical protein
LATLDEVGGTYFSAVVTIGEIEKETSDRFAQIDCRFKHSEYGVPADFDVEWDRGRVDTEGFAGVLKQFPPQRAFANAFCEFSNLGKDGIEVEASLVVVHLIDEILNSQIDYMCETWNMTKLQSVDPSKRIYLVIPKDSEFF